MYYQEYKDAINFICKDLGIDSTSLRWRFMPCVHIEGRAHYQHYEDGTHLIIVNSNQIHENIIHTIAHELRHIYQFLHSQLTYNSTNMMCWYDVAYPTINVDKGDIDLVTYNAYRALPWEIDANEYASNITVVLTGELVDY